jgi:ABC-type multidrug transport system fused ATPase/permease subunit
MLASSYPLLDIFFSIFFFFIFFLWIFLLIQILIDIFRSHDMNGWVKALWVLFLIILPFLGVLVYLIARGGKMQERALKDQKAQQDAFASYVKETAGTSGDTTADQLAKLADLKSKGVITDAEFDAQKAKILG